MGYVDGPSLYLSLGINPINCLDAAGLSSAVRNYAAGLVAGEGLTHALEPYCVPTGLPAFFASAFATIKQVDVGWKLNPWGAAATYSSVQNTMYIQRTADGLTILHELVHAMDDFNSWHVKAMPFATDYRAAEGLAYGMEYLLSVGGVGLQGVTLAKDRDRAKQLWDGVWGALNKMNYTVSVGSSNSALTATDIWDVNAKLGIRFSCSQLRPIYDKYFNDRGIKTCLKCPQPSGGPFD